MNQWTIRKGSERGLEIFGIQIQDFDMMGISAYTNFRNYFCQGPQLLSVREVLVS